MFQAVVSILPREVPNKRPWKKTRPPARKRWNKHKASCHWACRRHAFNCWLPRHLATRETMSSSSSKFLFLPCSPGFTIGVSESQCSKLKVDLINTIQILKTDCFRWYPPWSWHSTWKWIVGMLVSFWECPIFRGYVSFRECIDPILYWILPKHWKTSGCCEG